MTDTPKTSKDAINYETRLYIGNVEYDSTPEELKDHFKNYAVGEIYFPTRPVRGKKLQKGLAFIHLENAEEIDKFIEEYNKTDFKERTIEVRRAEPRAEKTERKKKEVKTEKPAKKPVKARVPLSEGTPSKDTVYITNIDFKLDSEKLEEYLKSETDYDIVSVKVPSKRLPGYLAHTLKKKGVEIRFKSRGFAFVTLKSEEEQKRFIAEFDGKTINDREVFVTPAIIVPTNEEVEDKKEEVEAKEEVAPVKE